MNLHRTDAEAEWQKISAEKRNQWQRTAAATDGIVTPGNLITFLGMLIALAGLVAIVQEAYIVGLLGLVIGRLFDILDGYAAHATHTKSPLGEAADASVDKLITLLTLIALTLTGIIKMWMLLALLIPHLLITIISLLALRRKQRLHPSRAGKLSMAFAWVALAGAVAAKAFPDISLLHTVSLVLGAVSVVLGVVALAGYIKEKQR